MTFKVLLQIPLSTFSGYGNDGIGIARAFIDAGADVYLMPTVVQAPLPMDVAALLTKQVKGPFDLALVHVDPMTLEASEGMCESATLVVGWTMWEYSNFKNLRGRSSAKKRWKNFDALVGYDQVSSDCLREYYSGPVLTQQGGYQPEDWPKADRDWDDPRFFFCQIGVLSERKDPFRTIQAFSELRNEHEDFAEFARLSLKTNAPGLHSKMEDVYPGLRVFYGSWPVEMVKEFYKANHVLLAPSRGEGKNLPALEFLSTGGTVIATNWGGHREWLHPDYAYGIDYTLEPVNADFPDTLNARADVEHMKELMLHAFRNRAEVRMKGDIGAAVVPALSSWDSVVRRLIEKLAAVPGGEQIHAKFLISQSEA